MGGTLIRKGPEQRIAGACRTLGGLRRGPDPVSSAFVHPNTRGDFASSATFFRENLNTIVVRAYSFSHFLMLKSHCIEILFSVVGRETESESEDSQARCGYFLRRV